MTYHHVPPRHATDTAHLSLYLLFALCCLYLFPAAILRTWERLNLQRYKRGTDRFSRIRASTHPPLIGVSSSTTMSVLIFDMEVSQGHNQYGRRAPSAPGTQP